MKAKIALSIIFGNSADSLLPFLQSFRPVIDHLVAYRAIGSATADNSAYLIHTFCEENGIPHSIGVYDNETDFPHVDNFGRARQESLEEAEAIDGATHIMWADCDDILADGAADAIRKACDTLPQDVLICPYHVRGDKQVVMRERIVRNNGFAAWQGAIHESMEFSRDVTYHMVREAVFTHRPAPTRSTSAPRNKAILKSLVAGAAKNYFYLAQEAFESNNVEDLKKWGNLALVTPGLDSLQRYETLLNLAQVETDPEPARQMASRAFYEMPDRREALALMANFHLIDGRYMEAHKLAKIMMLIPVPKMSYWTLNREWYGWKGFYLYNQTLRLTGQEDQATYSEDCLFEKNGKKISLLHATRGRPEHSLSSRDLWLSRASNPDRIQHIFCLDADDKQSIHLKGFRHVIVDDPGKGCVAAWNAGAAASTGEIIVQVSDDFFPPDGWDQIILDRLANSSEPAVLAVSDGCRTDGLMTIAIVNRARYEQKGYLLHPDFKSMFSDNYLTWEAKRDGVIIDARDVTFYHMHPLLTGAAPDRTYLDTNAQSRYDEGRATYEKLTR